MVSKKEFVRIIKFIEEKNKKQQALCEALESCTDGCYCDAFIYGDYESELIKLLKVNLNLSDDNEVIEYFIYDLNYGADYNPGCVSVEIDGKQKDVDLSTAEKLYEYLVK